MPQTLGKYEILELLGSGGYAQVYRARDMELGREVALKLLHPAHVMDENTQARFRQEGQVLARLVHPHIAFAWEFGQADGRFFIATRYIPGPSLDKMLARGGALSWNYTSLILRQIASALNFAHSKGIIHRDVKPANILIGEEEGAVLTDFGLVKALQAKSLTTSGGAFLGTPAYIPPEIWLGKAATPASDQYALACVLGEMLSGKTLFPGDTPPAVMTRHTMTGPLMPNSWPSDTPAGLLAALRKALSRAPEERFASLQEFIAALHPRSPLSPPASNARPAIVPSGGAALLTTASLPGKVTAAKVSAPDKLGFEWVQIQPGEFLYGANKQKVVVRQPFLISKKPVTMGQYQLFLKANREYPLPYAGFTSGRMHAPGEEFLPVTYISWNDAQAFCRWASQELGKEVRLPTALEWEKAARDTDGSKEPWVVNWVGGKEMEWVDNKYDAGESREMRSGKWNVNGYDPQSAQSYSSPLDSRTQGRVGFRCACSL